MAISVTKAADGSLSFPGATFITVKSVPGGFSVTSSDTLLLPVDTGPPLQAKIDKALIDLKVVEGDLV